MFGKSLAGNKYSRNFLHQAALRKTSPFSACPSARALPPRKTAIKNTPQLLARYLFGDPCGNLPRPKNSPRGCFCPAVRWTRGPGFSIPAWVTFPLAPLFFKLAVGAGHARPARFRKLLCQLRQPVLPSTTPATSASARAESPAP